VSLPYMPLYVGDYESDTAHLTVIEDGIYNRLLRLCWRSPGCKIPDNIDWIARKARVSDAAELAALQSVLAEFFTRARGKIFSRRLLTEYCKANTTSQNRKEAGKKGGAAKSLKSKDVGSSRAKAGLKPGCSIQNHNHNHKEEEEKELPPPPVFMPNPATEKTDRGGGGLSDDPAKGQTHRERLLVAMGADPVSGLSGPNGKILGTQADMAEVSRWQQLGLSPQEQLGVVAEVIAGKTDGMPANFRYFTPAMQRLAGAKQAGPIAPVFQGRRAAPPPKEPPSPEQRMAGLIRWADQLNDTNTPPPQYMLSALKMDVARSLVEQGLVTQERMKELRIL
jgi:uncharacterized protein YdaU (DUF1376 family)